MHIILRRPRLDKAALLHGLPAPLIYAHFYEEAAPSASAVLELDLASSCQCWAKVQGRSLSRT